MGKLKIWLDGTCREVSFEGQPVLQKVLFENGLGLDLPCGGKGRCLKCQVLRLEGAVSEPNEAEQKAGKRLTCQAVLLGDAEVELPPKSKNRIESATWESGTLNPIVEGKGIGCALDIGTTTLAMNLYDLTTGKQLASATKMNPQRSVAADVMGRIGAALDGKAKFLQEGILKAIEELLEETCKDAAVSTEDVKIIVAAGNTTMLYLLTGENPDCLSHAPFIAEDLFGRKEELSDHLMYYPPCMNAFVGADITCAVIDSGMYKNDEISLLCDIGTNGEIALWKNGHLFVTSTAAGPAFEGAGISSGCGSIEGAIDKVYVENGKVKAHTIGDKPAVGICGSGLIDAVAAFLETGEIDETGASESEELPLKDGISILPKDVRAVQLAKAAIAAGIQTLLELSDIEEKDIQTLYIAGGFGSHLNTSSAAKIGLIPSSLQDRVKVIGNGALKGAAAMLLDKTILDTGNRLAKESEYVNLGGNPTFNEYYIDQMFFE